MFFWENQTVLGFAFSFKICQKSSLIQIFRKKSKVPTLFLWEGASEDNGNRSQLLIFPPPWGLYSFRCPAPRALTQYLSILFYIFHFTLGCGKFRDASRNFVFIVCLGVVWWGTSGRRDSLAELFICISVTGSGVTLRCLWVYDYYSGVFIWG